MPLFPRKIAARIERTAEIHTPDGLIRTRVAAGGLDTAPAAPMSAGLTDQDQTLIHWLNPDAEAELLIVKVSPSAPSRPRVDVCMAAMWRVLAHADLAALQAELQLHPAEEPSGWTHTGDTW